MSMETKDQVAANALIGASVRVKSSIDTIDALLKKKTQSAALIEDVTMKVETALLPTIQECESKSLTPEEALSRLLKVTKDTISQLKSLSKSLTGEVAHLKGYAEGVTAAAKMVESIGNSILLEEERVRALAESDADLEKRRRPGERPETLRVKRKAAALREESSESGPEKSEDPE